MNQPKRSKYTRELIGLVDQFRAHLLFDKPEEIIDSHRARARARFGIRRAERLLETRKRPFASNALSLSILIRDEERNTRDDDRDEERSRGGRRNPMSTQVLSHDVRETIVARENRPPIEKPRQIFHQRIRGVVATRGIRREKSQRNHFEVCVDRRKNRPRPRRI